VEKVAFGVYAIKRNTKLRWTVPAVSECDPVGRVPRFLVKISDRQRTARHLYHMQSRRGHFDFAAFVGAAGTSRGVYSLIAAIYFHICFFTHNLLVLLSIITAISKDFQNQANACQKAEAKSTPSTLDSSANRQQHQVECQASSLAPNQVGIVKSICRLVCLDVGKLEWKWRTNSHFETSFFSTRSKQHHSIII
jgi:hypothetical protein